MTSAAGVLQSWARPRAALAQIDRAGLILAARGFTRKREQKERREAKGNPLRQWE